MNILPFDSKVNFAIIVATVAVGLDITFHIAFTEPMESFDYFAVKWLLGFFVATILLSWSGKGRNAAFTLVGTFASAASFSILMSIYYRWWEFVAGIPYGIRPPDIVFIDRGDLVLFAGAWFVGHSLFYVTGLLVARVLQQVESGPAPIAQTGSASNEAGYAQ